MARSLKDRKRDLEFGLRICQRREQVGVTQMELARRLGVSPGQIKSYETGGTSVRASTLEAIARVLEVPVSYFYATTAPDQLTEPIHPGVLASAQRVAAITDEGLKQDLLVFIDLLAAARR